MLLGNGLPLAIAIEKRIPVIVSNDKHLRELNESWRIKKQLRIALPDCYVISAAEAIDVRPYSRSRKANYS